MVTQALETLALVEISQGHPQSAGRLLAAATAMRMRMGTPNRPVDQFAVDYARGSVRAQLGTDTFAAMQAEAATAPPNQFLRAIPFAAAFSNTPAPSPAEPAQTLAHIDLGLAQEVPALYGRTAELARLSQWAQTDRCRLISLVGIGGIGKSSLAVTFARQAAAYFDVIIFRSLGEAPPLPDLLDQLIHRLSVQQIVAPPHLSEKLGLLVDLLRQSRCLLILDNLETLYQAGTTAGQFLPGYEPYGHLLQRLGQTAHKSCVILTSRERPAELAALESPNSLVRTLQLTGLPEEACRALLADQGLTGTTGDAAALGRRYDGNPLALKLVADPIRVLFSSDIAAFLSEASLFFEGVGQLLFQQIKRASRLEQTLLTWLAISSEPVGLDQVMKGLIGGASRAAVLVALHDLWRRNLIER
jgi:hypothetical protein